MEKGLIYQVIHNRRFDHDCRFTAQVTGIGFKLVTPIGPGFRRAKINLQHLDWAAVNAAIFTQKSIEAALTLTDKKGGPVCATLKPEHINWL